MKMILIRKLIVICQICFMMTKCAVRTLCISVHHAFIVCIPSAFLGSIHYLRLGVVIWQNWLPPKKLPPPLKNTWNTWETNRPPIPHPYDTVRIFLSSSPSQAYFKSMLLCDCCGPTTVLIHVMSLSQKKSEK